MERTRLLLAGVAIAALGLVACSSDSKDEGFTVTEKDFSVTPSETHVAAGKVTMKVENKGEQAHELVVFRTDLDANDLPLNADGDRIDEEGAGITHLDPEAEDIPVGGSKVITVDLPAGRYVFVCNLAGHYGKGMRAVVTTG